MKEKSTEKKSLVSRIREWYKRYRKINITATGGFYVNTRDILTKKIEQDLDDMKQIASSFTKSHNG